ncbi:urease accessory protein UreD [Nonomuraea longicatena]|uniref:Urease accessory protein UreD n=1 Tax=Nonomuraea longicatena TaxID=83682 RepID=A0ABP4A1S8_9ACTN
MRAAAVVRTVLEHGRTIFAELRSAPPLTLRQTGPHTVHLVSTAAGPLGGDVLDLALDLAPGTTLELASIGSSLVLPGPGESLSRVTARVGAEASLTYTPEPVVLASGAVHRSLVRLEQSPAARVLWREELVLGRHGEPAGRCRTRFDATVAGRPLLRQDLLVGDPSTTASPAVYGTSRCLGTTLITSCDGEEAVVGDGVAVLPLAGPGTLVSALADDTVTLRRRLLWGEAVAQARDPAP